MERNQSSRNQRSRNDGTVGSIAAMPAPAADHATCAWCRRSFPTIVDLIDHVHDGGHVDARPAAA
jgi:hypothetical protein